MTLFDQRVNIVPVWASFGFRGLFQVNCGDLIDPARLDLGVPVAREGGVITCHYLIHLFIYIFDFFPSTMPVSLLKFDNGVGVIVTNHMYVNKFI